MGRRKRSSQAVNCSPADAAGDASTAQPHRPDSAIARESASAALQPGQPPIPSPGRNHSAPQVWLLLLAGLAEAAWLTALVAMVLRRG